MVTIGMNYNVLPGKEEIFENAFRKVVKAMGGMDGHSETHMFRDIDDAKHYLIVSLWSSEPAFDAFIASNTFKSVTNWGKEQILSGRPKHEVYGGKASADPGGGKVSADPGVCPAGAH